MKKPEIMQTTIEICDIHAERLKKAREHLKPILPFKPEQISHFSDEQLGFLELLTSRFTKLQDIIGAKIFPLALDLLQENTSRQSFLDVLHKLEKLELLPSAKEWMVLREIRNHLTHEYPDNPQLMANNLNKVIEHTEFLLGYWQNLKLQLAKILKSASI